LAAIIFARQYLDEHAFGLSLTGQFLAGPGHLAG
jgi:hypothetical protein